MPGFFFTLPGILPPLMSRTNPILVTSSDTKTRNHSKES